VNDVSRESVSTDFFRKWFELEGPTEGNVFEIGAAKTTDRHFSEGHFSKGLIMDGQFLRALSIYYLTLSKSKQSQFMFLLDPTQSFHQDFIRPLDRRRSFLTDLTTLVTS
jgi:hypothetical protein